MEANLGIEFLESAPDPACVAFEGGGLQAMGGPDIHQQRAIIARHLRALKGFSADDISAAAREIDDDEEPPPGMDIDVAPDRDEEEAESDDGEDSDSDVESQDLPLADLSKKLEERLYKYQQAKRR